MLVSKLQSFFQTYNIMNRFCPGTKAAFLFATKDKRLQSAVFSNVSKTNSLGAMEFMGTHCCKIHLDLRKVEFIMTYGLHRVRMEQSIISFTQLTCLFYIQQVSNFIV